MGLSTELFAKSGEDLQTALEQVEFLQDRIIIIDNEKVPYDQAIYKLDENLLVQCDEVNVAFNNVQNAYNDRIVGVCRTDLFWRVTQINSSTEDWEYSLLCTKLTPGGYKELTKGGVVGLGSTVGYLHPNTTNITYYPCNDRIQEELSIGFGYTFGFDPRNYYGIKYYDEPYSGDIGDTFVGSFIGTITQGTYTLTVMQPVGLGLSESLEVGQVIVPEISSLFSGVTKISGITTGQADLRSIPSYVGIGTTLSWVNILTVDNVALESLKSPRNDGTFGSFEVLDDPDNFADEGREKYSIPKESDPFVPQTVGIMQTSTIGTGVSIALDNSGFPTAAMAWDPNLEGYIVEYDSRGRALAGPVEAPKVGAGQCFWVVGFDKYPKTSGGNRAAEGDMRTVDSLSGVYGSLSACSTALETAITDAVGVASAKETTLRGDGTARNLKIDGVNAMRGERNDDYSLPIWGMRVGIGAENEIVDRLNALQQHLDDLTIRDVIDS